MNSLLAAYNESDRAAYMKVVAYLAAVDGNLSSEEVYLLREMCMRYVIGPELRGAVLAATVMDHDELEKTLDQLAATDLKYSLLLDMCTLAYADGIVLEIEDQELRFAATRLVVEEPVLKALLELARCLHEAGAAGAQESSDKIQQAVAAVEACGVPRSALGFAETLRGIVRG